MKVHPDLPKDIKERGKKQRLRMREAREEGKTAYFGKPEPDKLFINGEFGPLLSYSFYVNFKYGRPCQLLRIEPFFFFLIVKGATRIDRVGA